MLARQIETLKMREKINCSDAVFNYRKEIFGKVLLETVGEPETIRKAKCLAAFITTKDIVLYEDELLAGKAQYCDCTYSHPNGLGDEIRKVSENGGADVELLNNFMAGLNSKLYQRGQAGHVIAGYDHVMRVGIGSLIEIADRKSVEFSGEKKDVADASGIICRALSEYILRYGQRAVELSTSLDEGTYKIHMAEIAKACNWISLKPARSFFEAVQLLWLTHEVVIFEQYCGSMSLGRIDQYLYPYYQQDLKSGIISKNDASLLIEALFIKMGGLVKGYQNVTLGGSNSDGSYAVNDLSYICLDASKNLKIDQPLLSVRWGEGMDDAFWNSIQELIEVGIGFPALFNDRIAIKSKTDAGVSPEDAQNYGIIGCVEVSVPGKEYAHTEGLRINWAKVLELMFTGGVCSFTDSKILLKQVRLLDSFTCFDEFYQWYQSELLHFLTLSLDATNALDVSYGKNWPTPYMSSLMEGCIENGRDVNAGGTKYNMTTVNGCGMANAVDALCSIKKIVFELKKMTLSELAKACLADFEGYEALRTELAGSCPKFGNDDDRADSIMQELVNLVCDKINSTINPRGGKFQSGLYTVEHHALMGKLTAALPDGRHKGISLANGFSPSQGADKEGPTAVLKSITKIDLSKLGNGMVLDLKFTPSFFESNAHKAAFRNMIETYFDLGGYEIQFNVIDRLTLIDAQINREQYQDLIVRVSGFSAYYVTLDKSVQDEIIARTEYGSL